MRSRCADLPATRARRPTRGARGAASLKCPYLFDWPDGAGLDRPSSRPRVSPRLVPDAPDGAVVDVVEPGGPEDGEDDEGDGDGDEAAVLDRGLVVAVEDLVRGVVVVDDFDVELLVVVVVDDFDVVLLVVVVVVDDFEVAPFVVVVVVDDRVPAFVVVVVVDALGTFGSSLAGASSRACAGAPAAAGAGGDPGGGGIRSSR